MPTPIPNKGGNSGNFANRLLVCDTYFPIREIRDLQRTRPNLASHTRKPNFASQ